MDENNKPIIYYDYDSCEPINPFIKEDIKDPKALKTFFKANFYPKIFGDNSNNNLILILIIICVISIVISSYSILMLTDIQNTIKNILTVIKPSTVIK